MHFFYFLLCRFYILVSKKIIYIHFWILFKQFPLRARSVFNFYQADFSPAGPISDANLVAPVSQLIDSESVVSIATTHEEYIQRHHDNAGNSFATSSTNLLFDI